MYGACMCVRVYVCTCLCRPCVCVREGLCEELLTLICLVISPLTLKYLSKEDAVLLTTVSPASSAALDDNMLCKWLLKECPLSHAKASYTAFP